MKLSTREFAERFRGCRKRCSFVFDCSIFRSRCCSIFVCVTDFGHTLRCFWFSYLLDSAALFDSRRLTWSALSVYVLFMWLSSNVTPITRENSCYLLACVHRFYPQAVLVFLRAIHFVRLLFIGDLPEARTGFIDHGERGVGAARIVRSKGPWPECQEPVRRLLRL